MAKAERTVEVDVDMYKDESGDSSSTLGSDSGRDPQYSDVLPDFYRYQNDTVPVEITVIGNKIYLDFPDWSSAFRKREQYEASDAWPTVDSFGDAHEKMIAERLDDRLLPRNARDETKTTQFCMGAQSVFRAFVRIGPSGSEQRVEPFRRQLGVLSDSSFTDDHTVSTKHPADDDVDEMHLELVDAVKDAISDMQDDDYWQGYRDGSGESWDEIAWSVFEESWSEFDDERRAEFLLDVGVWCAKTGVAVCSRSGACFPIPEWSRPKGSYVNTISDVFEDQCPSCGADQTEHMTCIESPASARLPNKYECQSCGTVVKGITTG